MNDEVWRRKDNATFFAVVDMPGYASFPVFCDHGVNASRHLPHTLQRPSLCAAGELVKEPVATIEDRNESVNELEGG